MITKLFIGSVALVFGKIAKLRRGYYKKNGRQINTGVRVVSVGNISFGGSGKSQLIMSILENADKYNKKVGVVSGSYGSKVSNECMVDLDKKDKFWGDEPEMIKKRFPNVPIAVGPKKWKTALFLKENADKLDLIVLDDGFQHLKLKRDLDIVLIDSSMRYKKFKIAPSGHLRESPSSLKDCEIIIISKTNLANSDELSLYKNLIKADGLEAKTFCSKTELSGLYDFSDQLVDFEFKKILLVSAIGNPNSFQTLVKTNFNNSEIIHLDYSDHHNYNEFDYERIIKKYKNKKIDCILCTEKDYIKLKKFNWNNTNIGYVKVDFKIFDLNDKPADEKFYGQIY